MPGKITYLEAPDRTQELLNIKWTLLSAGHDIRSTWHDADAVTSPLKLRDHWNAKSLEQMRFCDSLVVICGNGDRSMPELAMMAGFALARGMQVFWVGAPIKGLCDFRAVRQFSTPKDFEKAIVERAHSQSLAKGARLAA